MDARNYNAKCHIPDNNSFKYFNGFYMLFGSHTL